MIPEIKTREDAIDAMRKSAGWLDTHIQVLTAEIDVQRKRVADLQTQLEIEKQKVKLFEDAAAKLGLPE